MRPAGPVTAAVPTLSILPFALISSLPWHAPAWAAFALPLVPLTAVYLWAQHRSDLLPAPAVLLIGLFVDLVTDGPLGYWAALYLLAYAIGSETEHPATDTRFAVFLQFIIVLALLAAIGWLVASLYFWRIFDPIPFVVGTMLGAIIWPLVGYFLQPLVRWATAEERPAAMHRQSTDHV